MADTPKGPADKDCPFWKLPMVEVCHKCPLWTVVEQVDPDKFKTRTWTCGLSVLPLIAIEALQEATSTSIEINKLRDTVVGVGTGMLQLARRGQDLKQIEDGKE